MMMVLSARRESVEEKVLICIAAFRAAAAEFILADQPGNKHSIISHAQIKPRRTREKKIAAAIQLKPFYTLLMQCKIL